MSVIRNKKEPLFSFTRDLKGNVAGWLSYTGDIVKTFRNKDKFLSIRLEVMIDENGEPISVHFIRNTPNESCESLSPVDSMHTVKEEVMTALNKAFDDTLNMVTAKANKKGRTNK